jgi:opacity protein-like surface antigen
MGRTGRHLIAGLSLVAAAVTSLGTPPARAEDPAPASAPASDWGFTIAPYLWLTGMGGDVSDSLGRSASFDAGIGDVLSHLDGGFMLLGEARYKRFILFGDFDYAKLSTDSSAISPIRGQAGFSMKEYMGTVAGGYRLIDSPDVQLDALVGARVFSFTGDLSFSGAALPPSSSSDTATWADPIVALKGMAPIGSGDFFASGYVDVGGGPDGDLTWQIFGGVGYNFNQSIAAFLGYRYMAINHAAGNLDYNVSQQGPMIGVGFRF